ncbi:ABC transporter permease subunit [Paenibacillus sacheonensis]|uniref:ABC transporter permease subunit n=1 Tax=Paenibacillus sacheonensis TaxID=742054 RepID=A0A7X5C373_9BACL|nr:ABC transporter permease subunit [Paenibacillus sacheonensis]
MNAAESLRGLLFLLPWLCGVAFFLAYPLIYSIYVSFQKIGVKPDGSGLSYTYVGWSNFRDAFILDNEFPVEMLQFVYRSVLTVPVSVIFALLVALMLNQRFPGRMVFRTIFFLPVIFATGEVIQELNAQGQGTIPFLQQYNVTDLLYSTFSPSVAKAITGILDQFVIVLWYSGIQILIFLAAFQTIAKSTYEAAQIDGATPWESFWKITFPAIVPFIVLNLIYTVVDLATYPFNPVLKLITLNMEDVDTGYGYASALGWIYFIILLIPIAVLVIWSRRQTREKR